MLIRIVTAKAITLGATDLIGMKAVTVKLETLGFFTIAGHFLSILTLLCLHCLLLCLFVCF